MRQIIISLLFMTICLIAPQSYAQLQCVSVKESFRQLGEKLWGSKKEARSLVLTASSDSRVNEFREAFNKGDFLEEEKYISFVDPSTGERIAGKVQYNTGQLVSVRTADGSSVTLGGEALNDIRVSSSFKQELDAAGTSIKGQQYLSDTQNWDSVDEFLKANDNVPGLSRSNISKHGIHWGRGDLANLARIAKDNPDFVGTLNGSFLFHGGRGDSLMGLVGSSSTKQGLVPTGKLLEQGKVPYSGELAHGISDTGRIQGGNLKSLSSVHLYDIEESKKYATARSVNEKPPTLKEYIADVNKEINELEKGIANYKPKSEGDPTLSIMKKQLEVYRLRQRNIVQLSPEEQKLVLDDFPVLYGMAPASNKVKPAFRNNDNYKEVLVESGSRAEEIKVIYVPADRVSYVQSLLRQSGQNIPVHPLELVPGR